MPVKGSRYRNGTATERGVWQKQKRLSVCYAIVFFGSPTWTRTRDLRINRKPGSSKTM